jgi:hypothetical protein
VRASSGRPPSGHGIFFPKKKRFQEMDCSIIGWCQLSPGWNTYADAGNRKEIRGTGRTEGRCCCLTSSSHSIMCPPLRRPPIFDHGEMATDTHPHMVVENLPVSAWLTSLTFWLPLKFWLFVRQCQSKQSFSLVFVRQLQTQWLFRLKFSVNLPNRVSKSSA